MKRHLFSAGGMLAALMVSAVAQSVTSTINPATEQTDEPTLTSAGMLTPNVPNSGIDAADAATMPMQSGLMYPGAVEAGTSTYDGGYVPLDEDGKAVQTEETRPLWKLSPRGGVGVVFDDNIYISNTNRVSDVIFSVSAGLAFQLGDYREMKENYLIASWLGTGYFFTENPSQNAFNQNAALLGQYRFGKLTTQLETRYQYLTGADRNVGNFANRNLITTALRGIYEVSDKTTIDAEFQQNNQIYEAYNSQYEYVGKLGADYQVLPKVKLGLEGVAGILDVENSSLQYYQQARIRASYAATGKLVFKASGGIELREFADGEEPIHVTPVFSLGLTYTPFDGTSIDLTGYRNVIGSASINGQDYTATGFQIGIQQRVLQRFYVGVAVGYENDTYFATQDDTIDSNRVDNYFFVRPGVSYSFLNWLSASVFYEFRNNASNESVDSFYNNRVGTELAFQF